MLVRISKAAAVLGVSPSTLRVWDKQGRFPASCRTQGKHRRYELTRLWDGRTQSQKHDVEQIGDTRSQILVRERAEKVELRAEIVAEEQHIAPCPKVLAYARVSGHKQKDDLQTQVQDLQHFAQDEGWQLIRVHKDIASGMNEERQGRIRLLKQVALERPLCCLVYIQGPFGSLWHPAH